MLELNHLADQVRQIMKHRVTVADEQDAELRRTNLFGIGFPIRSPRAGMQDRAGRLLGTASRKQQEDGAVYDTLAARKHYHVLSTSGQPFLYAALPPRTTD